MRKLTSFTTETFWEVTQMIECPYCVRRSFLSPLLMLQRKVHGSKSPPSFFLTVKRKLAGACLIHPLTDEEINILYNRNVLGSHTPQYLLNTLWLNNSVQFGLRGVHEHYNLRLVHVFYYKIWYIFQSCAKWGNDWVPILCSS
jgi:hypothetical protein